MPELLLENFAGIDNRQREESIPEHYLKDAINVDLTNEGKAIIRYGTTEVLSGIKHSLSPSHISQVLFVDSGTLKRLNSDDTTTTLGTVGDSQVYYAEVGTTIYLCNDTGFFKLVGDSLTNCGVERPSADPVLTATETGGLYAGDYQVTLTWIDQFGEESGARKAVKVTVAEGGGIHVGQIPEAPSEATLLGIYVTEVNSETLYLYDELLAATTEAFIGRTTVTIPLETQFARRVRYGRHLTAHYGRLYFADGELLRWTMPQRYGLVNKNAYARFGGEIKLIASLPGVLYVVADQTYRIFNIDAEGFPVRQEELPYSASHGSVSYDLEREVAWWQGDRGINMATSEGVVNRTLDHVAMPKYVRGSITSFESNGIRRIVSANYGNEDNTLAV